jgi:hypothetical protein
MQLHTWRAASQSFVRQNLTDNTPVVPRPLSLQALGIHHGGARRGDRAAVSLAPVMSATLFDFFMVISQSAHCFAILWVESSLSEPLAVTSPAVT